MGYDITFHPVSADDLQRWLFDIVADPSLANSRSWDISVDHNVQELTAGHYDSLKTWKETNSPFNATYAMIAAAVAGCRHPYWYSRGNALSVTARKNPAIASLFIPLPELAKGPVSAMKDVSAGKITANYTASGMIAPERIGEIFAQLPSLAPSIATERGSLSRPQAGTPFESDNFKSLLAALNYAKANNLGLMEASDLVVPISNQCASDFNKLRAPFLKKMDP